MPLIKQKIAFWLFTICILLLNYSCTNKPDIGGFDAAIWKADRFGCAGNRQALLPRFDTLRPRLLGMSETDFATLFGRPDRQDMRQRSTRFYIYFTKPGSQCKNLKTAAPIGSYVKVRISAINIINEISYSNDETGIK